MRDNGSLSSCDGGGTPRANPSTRSPAVLSFSNVTLKCFQAASRTVPSGKAWRGVKPESTTEDVVKAKVSARRLSLLPMDERLTAEAWLQAASASAAGGRGKSSAPIRRGRAREGSLRSSILLWDPYRCSHAAHSGMRSGIWPNTIQSDLQLP